MKWIQQKHNRSSKIIPAAEHLPRTGTFSWRRIQRITSQILLILLGMLLLSACALNLDTVRSWLLPATSTPESTNTITTDITPTAQNEVTPTALPQTAQEITTPHVLTLWIPPQFDPEAGTPAAALLKARLDDFIREYPNVELDVRLKAVSGPGGLLESLTSTSAAAPDALPTLILLNRPALETASLKGLIQPLDEMSTAIDNSDWYDYARELAIIQGTVYGLPFTGDAALLVYRPARFPSPPLDWETILSMQQPIIFPASDPEGLLTLTLYESMGGTIQDTQLRPTLNADQLSVVFKLYEDGARSAVFPAWITQYQNDSQAWQAYSDQTGNAVVTWSTRYLTDLPADSSAAALPTLGDEPYTVADGWMWALADTDPEGKILGATLAEYLVDPTFLAEWSPSTGTLPTRPSSLNAQTNQNLKTLLSQIVVAAHVRPANDLTTTIGPIVQEATVQILKRQINSIDAATTVVEKLAPPEQ